MFFLHNKTHLALKYITRYRFSWQAPGCMKLLCVYLQCRESASKVPHQSASEEIYWFCKWKKKILNLKMLHRASSSTDKEAITVKYFNTKHKIQLTWWLRRSTVPGVVRRSSVRCRSAPSPWLLPAPPPPAAGQTSLKHTHTHTVQ